MDDSDTGNPFGTPEHNEHHANTRPNSDDAIPDRHASRFQPTRHDQGEAREQALHRELESVKGANKVLENLIESLQKSRNNMETVQKSVQSASTLLDTWTRILSQTEYNQRLILHPNWHGATQDMEDLENESMMRQQATERRALEDQMRREAAARQAEEEDSRKKLSTTPSTRVTRGRGRGTGPRGGSSMSGTSSASSSRGRVSSRAGSGIGRGIGGARGRGRGTM